MMAAVVPSAVMSASASQSFCASAVPPFLRKATPCAWLRKLMFSKRVFAGIVVKILLQRAIPASGGIDIAGAQRGEDLPELGVGRELGESGELVIQSVGQDVLGGGARLHGDTLTRKALDRADPAVRAHDDHTLGVEVGPGPEELVLTAIHRQAAPQTVDLARGKTGKALIERDLAKNGLIADATAGLGRNLHVDACVAAAHTA